MEEAPPPQEHMLLTYTYVPDMQERRRPYREGHLALIRAWKDDGRILLAGAMGNPARALFVLRGPEDAHEFVKTDPYARNGLVTQWNAEPLVVV